MSFIINPYIHGAAPPPPTGGVGFGAFVSRTTSQTVPTGGTEVAITWVTEDRDDGGTPGYWDSGSPTRVTVDETGYYLVAANVKLSDSTGAQWRLQLRISGSENIDPVQAVQGDSSTDWTSVSAVMLLTAGQYVEVYADHNETNDEEIEAGNFSIAWIGTAGAGATVASQAILNNTATALSFDTEASDTGSYVDIGGTPTRLTFGVTGWYVFGASVGHVSGAGDCKMTIKLNGTTDLAFTKRSGGTWSQMSINMARYMTATDYVEFIVTQEIGSTQNFAARAWLAYKASGQGAHATRLTTQTMGPTADTAWILTAEQRDDGGFIDVAGANPTRMTIPVTGWYLAGGSAEGPAASGFYKNFIRVDGAGTDGIANSGDGQNTTVRAGLTCNTAYYFTSGQYFELVFGNSAGANRIPQNAYVWVLELGGVP